MRERERERLTQPRRRDRAFMKRNHFRSDDPTVNMRHSVRPYFGEHANTRVSKFARTLISFSHSSPDHFLGRYSYVARVRGGGRDHNAGTICRISISADAIVISGTRFTRQARKERARRRDTEIRRDAAPPAPSLRSILPESKDACENLDDPSIEFYGANSSRRVIASYHSRNLLRCHTAERRDVRERRARSTYQIYGSTRDDA